jgi:glycosyltransferase involved in cell wall biosynthesis
MRGNSLSVIILTYNENIHLKRCINSIKDIATEIFIVDSFSSDETVELSQSLGANVYQNKWKNYATQFNWGLKNCPIKTKWVMRLDADEVITPELAAEIKVAICKDDGTRGFVLNRGHIFLGKKMKHGGTYPTKLLRIWENANGYCENKWMDEHIILKERGKIKELKHSFWDHNLNHIGWWTEKHNGYATREAIDQLNKKYNLFNIEDARNDTTQQSKLKKLLKNRVYEKFPKSFRSFLYFLYRYIIRLGFLDGYQGLVWHFLQGFWYRFLIDVKVYEIEKKAKKEGKNVKEVINEEYGYQL